MENFAIVSSEMPNQFVSALMLFLSFYQSTLTINQPSLSINPDYQSTLTINQPSFHSGKL